MASKKLTLKMVKDFEKGIVDEEAIKQIMESAKIEADRLKAKGFDKIPEGYLLPISEDNDNVLDGIGAAVCFALRMICTDAAWKYIANDFIESFKVEDTEENG